MVPYTLVTSAEDLGKVASEISSAESIGLDIETTALQPFDGEIRLVQINTGKGIYVIDLFQTKTLGPVEDVLREQRTIVIGHNLKFEQRWLLWKYGLELWPIFDTWRASEIIYNGYNLGHNLYDLYRRELKLESEIPDHGASDWSGPLTQSQLDYAAEDVAHLHKLREVLKPKVLERALAKVALIEFGAILPEASVENNGLYVDKPSWLDLAAMHEVKAKQLRSELLYELPDPKDQMALPGFSPAFNLDSPIQMLESFHRLGITKLEDTKEMSLAMHAAQYPVISKLLDYREASKRLDTYGPEWLQNIHPVTGYVHSSFYPFTGAGRYASSKPNIQNIPRDAAFRACFKAEPGHVLILSDFGNIEMRIIAELSGDKLLIQIFVDDGDAHYRTASILTGKAESEITKKERQEAKPVNFGFIYGMQAAKLVLYAQSAYKVSLTPEKAKLFRQRYFEAYVGVGRWHRKIENALEACKKSNKMYEARTLAGRLRMLNAQEAFNEAKNTPSQGTGADGLKAALREVYMRLKKYGGTGRWDQPFTVKMRNHVHDEIMLSAPSSGSSEDKERQEYARKDLSEGMKAGVQPMLKRVPVTADAVIADSWAEK